MFAFAFKRNGNRKQGRYICSRTGNYVADFGFAARDGSRFVENHGFYLACLFKRFCGLEKDSVACADAVADHYCHGRCKPECAWAADYKDRYCSCKRKAYVFADKQPDDKRYDRD